MQEQKEDIMIVTKSKPTAMNLAATVSTSSSSVSSPMRRKARGYSKPQVDRLGGPKRAHLRAPTFKNTTKIPREDPQREREKERNGNGRGKTSAKFWAVWLGGKPKASDLEDAAVQKLRLQSITPPATPGRRAHWRPPLSIAGSRCGCSQLEVEDLSSSDGRVKPPPAWLFLLVHSGGREPRQPLGHCCMTEACPRQV